MLGMGLILFTGCKREVEEKCAFVPPVKDRVSLEFHSLSDSVISFKSKEELVSFLGRYPVIRDYFLRRSLYPNDSVFVAELYQRFTNNYMDSLRTDVKNVFDDERALKQQFEEAFSNMRYYYPDAPAPKIITLVTGLDNDMLVSDSLIIVSLDYYLGPKARYRPNMYEYLLRQYVKENIVPSTMLLFGMNRYTYTNLEDERAIADMMAFGKSYYFAKHMLPCVPDSVFIWYTAEEVKGARENQDMIWYRLIEDQVLYSTNHMVKQRFLSERPFTIEVGEQCPGRIAQWVGWEIVKSYMKTHPEITLQQLMEETDAELIFKESRYKPVRK
ncbi:MAG: gliding motility lipoprotein GldB [Cyclobacteriaceae bacterium]|nr:gliding motility lipoprotein GldB [Cyclobacteriaceae bacterium]